MSRQRPLLILAIVVIALGFALERASDPVRAQQLPPTVAAVNAAAQNKDLQELLSGSGQCNLNNASTLSSYQGVTNNLVAAYNTRFGVYPAAVIAAFECVVSVESRMLVCGPDTPVTWQPAPVYAQL